MLDSLSGIDKRCREENKPFWQIVMEDDCHENEKDPAQAFEQVKKIYHAMRDSYTGYDETIHSRSGLVGAEGAKLKKAHKEGKLIAGDFIADVMEKALKIGESNACMKRIVAAPTAGSCGVLPAVLLTVQEHFGYTDEEMVKAVFVAAGIGEVISQRACLSGAQGGCQAEIGSASAMAAGALAFLRGGTPHDIGNAAALALKNLLGLACDPVAGLVEVPCVKRNVIGAVNAVTSSDLTVAGVFSRIPPDEVIDAMSNIGKRMSSDIKETAEGGLAATPTGEQIKASVSF